MNIDILEKLIEIYSPSNNEQKMCDYIRTFSPKNFKEINKSPNSVTYFLDNNKKKTLLVDAHIDEVCSKIVNITNDGFILVKVIGTSPDVLLGRPVKILSSKQDDEINGVFLINVPHLEYERGRINDEFNDNLLYVDIGLSTKEEVLSKLEIGDPVMVDYKFRYLTDKVFSGRALDNKLGTSVLLNLLTFFDGNKSKSKYNLILHFSGREEMGGMQYLNLLRPEDTNHNIDEVIVIDTGFSTDVPFLNSGNYGNIKLGLGPIVQRSDLDIGLYKKIKKISKDKNIPIQIEYPLGGGSNLQHFAKFNSLTQFLGIPARNLHSPVEIVNIDDINNMFELVKSFIIAL